MLTFICYIQVNFTFALVDCARCNKDFVNPRFVKSRDKIALGNCLISHTKHHIINMAVTETESSKPLGPMKNFKNRIH